MGVRLYAPGSGRFLSTDPVYGGSLNAYEYCGGDAVGCADTTGQFRFGGFGCWRTGMGFKGWWFWRIAYMKVRCEVTNSTLEALVDAMDVYSAWLLAAGGTILAVAGVCTAFSIGACAPIAAALAAAGGIIAAIGGIVYFIQRLIVNTYKWKCRRWQKGVWWSYVIFARVQQPGTPWALPTGGGCRH